MTIQAVHLGPKEALRLVHLDHAATAGTHPVFAATTSCLASIQARAYAVQGDAVPCDRALGQAVEQFGGIDPATRPPWGTYFDETGLAAKQGAAHEKLDRAGRDPRVAGRAVPLLCNGVDHFGPDYARPRALYLLDLAGAHALAGDTDTAVSVATKPSMRSRRCTPAVPTNGCASCTPCWSPRTPARVSLSSAAA